MTMDTQANIYPMYFTLERVENGFVLTAKEQQLSPAQEPKMIKEVVMNEKIDARLGQLLRVGSLIKERPTLFRVEALNIGTYNIDQDDDGDENVIANQAYVNFMSRKYDSGIVVALELKDKGYVEIYGQTALQIGNANSIPIQRSCGIPFLRFSNSKDGMKQFSSYCTNVSLQSATQEDINKWYKSHKVELEKEVKAENPPKILSKQG